ncbi:MAG: septum site-determining protein MinC [Methylococcales bacterium]|jgi:septum site-determining protein MinC|nr:septum site-determining protein MinC [Methylococcales bacterium]
MATQRIKRNPSPSPAFDLKGSLFTLTVMKLMSHDLDIVSDQLAIKVNQAPAFFQSAPIVIDLQMLPENGKVDFALLVGLLRGFGFIPVGIVGGSHDDKEMARAMDLAILSLGKNTGAVKAPPVITEKIEEKIPELKAVVAAPENKLVTKTVRSGQRIYAPNGDLIIMASVGSGAELLASGNIHVYGQLRGRALAGVNGDESARVFCQSLNAELVSVAGHYKVNEDLSQAVRGRPTQVFLEGDKLRISLLQA